MGSRVAYAPPVPTAMPSPPMNSQDMLHEALRQARAGLAQGGLPIGSVLVDEAAGQIVARGHNLRVQTGDPTAHAEMVAIRNACKKLGTFSLQGHSLYTSCEPCPMCLSAIYWCRVDRVYYGNTRKDAKDIGFDDDFIYDEVAKPLGHRKIPITQCGEDYAKKAFVLWENTDKKTPY